jgi:hypothetical protein
MNIEDGQLRNFEIGDSTIQDFAIIRLLSVIFTSLYGCQTRSTSFFRVVVLLIKEPSPSSIY